MALPLQTDSAALTDFPALTAEVEFTKSFAFAKEALTYVCKFRTPPTPEVYKVWYRFAEGENVAIQQQISHAINATQSVSKQQLEQLHQQFLHDSELTDVNEQISHKLASEMADLQALIRSQLDAGAEFDDSISSASTGLLAEFVTPAEVKSCIDSVLAKHAGLQQQMREMESTIKESEARVERLRMDLVEAQKTMLSDPVTGIGNRRFFEAMMSQAFQQPADRETHLFLMLVDLDQFKRINDAFGHATGDEVLRYVATRIRSLAADASIARYGGDEFAVVANVIEREQAQQLADRICDFFARNKLTLKRSGETLGQLTISLGAALLRPDDNRESWFGRADQLLQHAKRSGRNRAILERQFAR